MFARLAQLILRRARAILLAGLLLALAGSAYGLGVFQNLKGGGFYNPDADSSKVRTILQEQLGQSTEVLLVLFTARDELTVDAPEYRQAVEATLERLSAQPYVGRVVSYYLAPLPQFVSGDRRSTYAVAELSGDQDEQNRYVAELRPLLTSDRLQVRLGGQPAVYQEINLQVSEDIARAELLTFPIVAVLLALVFGSLVAASLPLLIGGLSIILSFMLIRLATNVTDVSIFAVNIVTMLGLGLAIDYSLFIVSRFREELLRQQGDVSGALLRTMQTAGRTVFFSGMTVAISMLGLLVFPQMFLKSIGFGGASAVLIAMLSSVTLLPAALALLGPRINALPLRLRRRAAASHKHDQQGFWYQLSQFVMRHPVAILLVTLLPLLLAGSPFLRARFSIPDARGLPVGSESRVVAELLEREFPRNETQPMQMLVHVPGSALAPASLEALSALARRVAAVEGVRRVDSLVTLDPRMDQAALRAFYAPENRSEASIGALLRYGGGEYTLFSILYDSDPLSAEAQALVRRLRALEPPAGMQLLVGGGAATVIDFLESLAQQVPYALALIIAVIFILLFLMLGSLLVPLKAVLLNLLSLSASFGALVWIFQDGNLADLLGFTPLGSVDATQPVLIFAIAFGLSMDYEVFLLSRIKEQYDKTGDMATSVALGVQKTGQIITSAALLLGVVIGAFATGKILSIKQVGVGLSLALLLDATIVRMFLVPATMQLMGRYNWWAPAPLARLYQRMGMGEVEQEEPEVVATEARLS